MDRDERFTRAILIAWIVWAVSLCLPAAGIRADEGLLKSDFFLRGWQVAVIAVIDPLKGMSLVARIAIRIMGLTNAIMFASPVTQMFERRSVRRIYLGLTVGAVGLNASALFFNFASMLAYGYWIWLASFVALARAIWRFESSGRRF